MLTAEPLVRLMAGATLSLRSPHMTQSCCTDAYQDITHSKMIIYYKYNPKRFNLNGSPGIGFAEKRHKAIGLVARVFRDDFHVSNLAKSVKEHQQVALDEVGRDVADEYAIGNEASWRRG